MFVLTRGTVIYGVICIALLSVFMPMVQSADPPDSMLEMLLPFGVLLLIIGGLRGWLFRREDSRHHRGSLEFSYGTVAMVMMIPLLIVFAFTIWKNDISMLVSMGTVIVTVSLMNYFRARKRLKDYTPAELFEAEVFPQWAAALPWNNPTLSLGLYAVVAAAIVLGTAWVLGSATPTTSLWLQIPLMAASVLILFLGPFPGLSSLTVRGNRFFPYLYTIINMALLLLAQFLFLKGSVYSDPNHPAAFVCFWVMLLSLSLPPIFTEKRGWVMFNPSKTFK